MKNKYIIITAFCLFLIVAGVCYSCSYKDNYEQEILLLSDDIDEEAYKAEGNDSDGLNIEGILQSNDLDHQVHITEDLNESVIYVYICGAVVSPDVYQVEEGTRIVDLIKTAGGLTPEAASNYINQAMEAEDGQRIYIPTRDELKELSLDEYIKGDNNYQASEETDKKVNINTADESELTSLPGIGQAKAKSIIEYRDKNGSFRAITDLMSISGIKEGLFAQIEELIIVK
ncbi:MAG: helix-hairpin-helix domain-containing protein [Herbinix sp.]|nr:helix-hairpin-helix domain-containing protein [Herbinix sp.]